MNVGFPAMRVGVSPHERGVPEPFAGGVPIEKANQTRRFAPLLAEPCTCAHGARECAHADAPAQLQPTPKTMSAALRGQISGTSRNVLTVITPVSVP